MKRARVVVGLLAFTTLVAVSAAHARKGSVKVNAPAARTIVAGYVGSNGQFDTTRMHGPHEELLGRMAPTLKAIKAGEASRRGLANIYGLPGGVYVVHDAQSTPFVLSLSTGRLPKDPAYTTRTYFVLRDGDTGIVQARGHLTGGKLVWTRSHNERGKQTPSERNAQNEP